MSFFNRLGASSRGEYDTVDASENLMVKEGTSAAGLQDEYQVLLRSKRRMKRWIQVLSSLLVISVIVLAVTGFHNLRKDSSDEEPSPNNDAEPLTPVPPMPRKAYTFEQNPLYAGPSTPENDAAWAEMGPPGDGFVLIPNGTEKYGLPSGKASTHGDVYDISMWHQLHCLRHIRMQYYLLESMSNPEVLAQEGGGEPVDAQAVKELLLAPQEEHVHHCFDYIRQALMCAGDMTVEWPREEEDGRRFAVDGWGITHQCKDWDAIMDYMKENDVSKIVP